MSSAKLEMVIAMLEDDIPLYQLILPDAYANYTQQIHRLKNDEPSDKLLSEVSAELKKIVASHHDTTTGNAGFAAFLLDEELND